MNRVCAVLIMVFVVLIGVGCGRPSSQLTGTWVGHPDDGTESAGVRADPPGSKYTLTFAEDGTFTGHISTRIMMVLEARPAGTYSLSGDEVVLTGKSEGTMDDGYRKEAMTVPYSLRLTLKGDRLIERGRPEGPRMLFAHE